MAVEQKKGDIKYLTPLNIDTSKQKKYCRFKKSGIKYIDYKDADFLLKFVNEQGKLLPRRLKKSSPLGFNALCSRFIKIITRSRNYGNYT